MRSWTAAGASMNELRRPVFLAPGGVVAAGTRCAAVMLDRCPITATDAEVRKFCARSSPRSRSRNAKLTDAMHAKTADWHAWFETNAPAFLARSSASTPGGLTAAKAAYRRRWQRDTPPSGPGPTGTTSEQHSHPTPCGTAAYAATYGEAKPVRRLPQASAERHRALLPQAQDLDGVVNLLTTPRQGSPPRRESRVLLVRC